MVVIAEKGKRTAGGRMALAVVMLAFFVLPAGAEQKQKQSIGIYTGWSFGLGDAFKKYTTGGHTDNLYKLYLILGAYYQHNFSESLGLQFSMNYQRCSNHWDFYYWERDEEGVDQHDGLSFNLNGIFNYARSASAQFYFLGGMGTYQGELVVGSSFIDFSGGTGVKLRVKPGARTAVNLAAVFHHLLKPGNKKGSAAHADYLRLQCGLEFIPKSE